MNPPSGELYPPVSAAMAMVSRKGSRARLRPELGPALGSVLGSVMSKAAPRIVLAMLLAMFLAPALAGCASGSGLQPGAQSSAARQTLVVLAASSLTEVFQELGEEFRQANPNVRLVFNFAGSQRLRAQLELGAQADVFASADWQQMTPLASQGLLLDQPSSFASNRLALISPLSTGKRGGPLVTRLEDLVDPEVKLVLATAAVPAGNYSRRVLELAETEGGMEAGFAEKVLANLVSEEANVRSVAQKVALGEADAGLVYLTDVRSGGISSRVAVIHIPDHLNPAASYPVAVLKDAKQPALARQFVQFLHTDLAQAVLRQHGFGPGAGMADSSPATVKIGTVSAGTVSVAGVQNPR